MIRRLSSLSEIPLEKNTHSKSFDPTKYPMNQTGRPNNMDVRFSLVLLMDDCVCVTFNAIKVDGNENEW